MNANQDRSFQRGDLIKYQTFFYWERKVFERPLRQCRASFDRCHIIITVFV